MIITKRILATLGGILGVCVLHFVYYICILGQIAFSIDPLLYLLVELLVILFIGGMVSGILHPETLRPGIVSLF